MFTRDLIGEIQDLRYLKWSRLRKSSGTAGSYLKSYGEENDRKIYYKLSCYDRNDGITGHECINELIVDRLLNLIEIEHIHYQLIHGIVSIDGKEWETWLCASEDYKEAGDNKIALDEFYEINRSDGESAVEFCNRMGWDDYIYRMLAVDYLILNRDRHGANIEILKRKRTGDVLPAPLFDHGLSLLFNCRSPEEANAFDVMEDKPVQCYVGGNSAIENLDIIPSGKKPRIRRLDESDRNYLFAGLDKAINEEHLNKIWEMISKRISYYESL